MNRSESVEYKMKNNWDDMSESEKIREFRRGGCSNGPLELSTFQCDFYAEFMRRKGPDNLKEWADRFATGRMFQISDRENKQKLLDVMMEGMAGSGNARHLDEKDKKKFCSKDHKPRFRISEAEPWTWDKDERRYTRVSK